ncbi:GIY-YIG nuclease family protein [Streptomyces arboris]|uniref:GIY-YIG nuclease family protein n=1 Tax=Streptomyces arboris TaxID=2600619 RepID=UPI003BF57BCB
MPTEPLPPGWQDVINGWNWAHYGYDTWADYCARDEALSALRDGLVPAQRKTIVRAMVAAGMLHRQIAPALGVDRATVQRDINGRSTKGTPGVSFVYVIGSTGFSPVKIGKGNPESRLDTLQTGSPFLLEILWRTLGGLALERALHARFEPLRVRGEWFGFPEGVDPVKAIADAVADIAAGLAPTA